MICWSRIQANAAYLRQAPNCLLMCGQLNG
jgi:hypothetical protein